MLWCGFQADRGGMRRPSDKARRRIGVSHSAVDCSRFNGVNHRGDDTIMRQESHSISMIRWERGKSRRLRGRTVVRNGMDGCATTHPRPRPRPHPPPIKRIHPHTAARPPQLGDRGVGATQPARALTHLTRPPTRRLERVGPRKLLLVRRGLPNETPLHSMYTHSRQGRDPLKRRGYFGPGCIGSASPAHCAAFRPSQSRATGVTSRWPT